MKGLQKLIMAAGAVYCLAAPASALTVGLGDVVDIDSCTNADACVLSGTPIRNYFNFGDFDLFYATFRGTAGEVLNWSLTPLVDLELTQSIGLDPIDADAGNGTISFLLTAGTTTILPLQFGNDDLITFNLATRGADAVSDAGSYFAESGFAFDPVTGSFGVPEIGSGGGSGGVSSVPLPASALLLFSSMFALSAIRRKKG
ncbi:VPLPA-CTERM sorting domain-containing protein [uncultured Roseobacter sp.]|uniref:VPLPA-CTERM sorting domain-containing protein n=1 Tax=uncultured Roseobacter sp. TaxID=114847 RepID=UPI00260341C4|nr:VPLPA-CTERM sorting domain-containing protein [uncultured Roseobacter sp.]